LEDFGLSNKKYERKKERASYRPRLNKGQGGRERRLGDFGKVPQMLQKREERGRDFQGVIGDHKKVVGISARTEGKNRFGLKKDLWNPKKTKDSEKDKQYSKFENLRGERVGAWRRKDNEPTSKEI